MIAPRPLRASAEHSRSAVLDLIRSSGSISRTELADLSGLTAASITRIVKTLLDTGLVVETGLADSTGGKRRSLLGLDPRASSAIGVSLDSECVVLVLTDSSARVQARAEVRGIGHAPPRLVVPRLAADVRAFLEEHRPEGVAAVGVAGAGLDLGADAERMSVAAPEWESFPVQEELEAALGVPVVRDNDAACAALGEFWTGRVPATQDLATLYMAEGFGLGLVVAGRLLRGASANTGEIGHLAVQVDGPPCWCGATGCLEVVAGPRAVVAGALRHPRLSADLGISGSDERLRHDFDAVAGAARGGDRVCLALVRESARLVAAAVLSVVNLLDLDRIHLAGPGFRRAGDLYVDAVRDAVHRAARTRDVHGVTIELSDPGLDAAAVGAASLALQYVLTPHTRAATAQRARSGA